MARVRILDPTAAPPAAAADPFLYEENRAAGIDLDHQRDQYE